MMYGLGSALVTAAAAADVSVLILAARGPVFSAGVDLKAYAEAMASATGPAEINAAAQAGASASRPGLGVLIREPYPKPVICAVQGPALGLGCELVLASDIVIASNRATFGLPEVRHGLVAGGGGVSRLVQRVPWSRAMWMLLSGEPVDATAACRLGLVTEVAEADQDPVETALRMASVIADHSQAAVRETKALAVRSAGLFDAEAQQLGDDVMKRMSSSAEAPDRIRAFFADGTFGD